jgi:hypothetical protein
MAKVNCPCGHQISNVMCPSPNNGWLIRDMDTEDEDKIDPISMGDDVWECHNCGRLAIGNDRDNTIKWYTPENGEPGHLTDFDT